MAVSENAITWKGSIDRHTRQHIIHELNDEDLTKEDGFLKFTRYIDNPSAYIEEYGILRYLWKLVSPLGRVDRFYYCAQHDTVFKGTLRNLTRVLWIHRKE